MAKFEELLGKTIAAAMVSEDKDRITLTTTDGRRYIQWHSQDCCEHVRVEEIVGDLADIEGSPILLAEEVSHDNNETPEGAAPPEYPESYTWTFYKLATIKGAVTIRWLGESNGYYSESVDFDEVES